MRLTPLIAGIQARIEIVSSTSSIHFHEMVRLQHLLVVVAIGNIGVNVYHPNVLGVPGADGAGVFPYV
jgi:hypothetical protein